MLGQRGLERGTGHGQSPGLGGGRPPRPGAGPGHGRLRPDSSGPPGTCQQGESHRVPGGRLLPGSQERHAFPDRKAEQVWTLTTASLLHALDRGHTLDELRGYLDQAASHPVPQTVTTLLDDTGRRTGRLRDAGQTHLIECADETLAALIVSDRRLRVLCTRIGERHLAVSLDRLPAFRKAALALGYPLA
ncbi:helicase-associated domain-containing protein [Streptomyces laculatispora]|uniref:helicase-associated domain-containing protein n=1 Tax=Streptomyces laculatispora TaxID=887464 RepID=UPI0035186D86